MSFTAEEIARFDDVLSDMFESELRSVIWLMILFLAILIVLPFLPKDKRWRDTPLLDDGEKEPRYRNGKKLSRREREAERGKRHKRGEHRHRVPRRDLGGHAWSDRHVWCVLMEQTAGNATGYG